MAPVHVHLQVRDLERSRLYPRLIEAGVTIVKPLVRDDAFALSRCADPDGHAVEIDRDA